MAKVEHGWKHLLKSNLRSHGRSHQRWSWKMGRRFQRKTPRMLYHLCRAVGCETRINSSLGEKTPSHHHRNGLWSWDEAHSTCWHQWFKKAIYSLNFLAHSIGVVTSTWFKDRTWAWGRPIRQRVRPFTFTTSTLVHSLQLTSITSMDGYPKSTTYALA